MDPKRRKEALAAAAVNATLLRRMGIWRALSELLSGDADRTGRLQMAEGGDARGAGPVILLHSRRDVSATLMALPWLFLDGTMAETLTRYYLPRFKLLATIEAGIPHTKVTHIVRGWGRSNLIPHPKADGAENARRENFLAELCDFILQHGGGDALVVTHQEIEHCFAKLPGVRTAHFNAIRGLDAFGSVKAVFVLGRPLPSFDAHRSMALALTGDAIPEQTPHTEARGLLMRDGSNQGINVRVYGHPILEAIRAAVTDGEVIQALHRARPVNRTADNPVNLFVLADVVTTLPVDRIVAWADVRLTPVERMAARGLVFESPTDAVKFYPDIFTAGVDAARMAIGRSGGISRTSPYESILIRECSGNRLTRVLYRPTGKGQQTRTAWARNLGADQVRAMLVAMLGDLAQFEFGGGGALPETDLVKTSIEAASEAEFQLIETTGARAMSSLSPIAEDTSPITAEIMPGPEPGWMKPVSEIVLAVESEETLHACPFWREQECYCRPGYCRALAVHGQRYHVNCGRRDDRWLGGRTRSEGRIHSKVAFAVGRDASERSSDR